MAIYHHNMKAIQRSAGRTATAAAAYRAACRVVDDRTGEIHDYTRKGGVQSARLILPGGGTADRAGFWSRVEVHHKHPRAVTAREVVVALPKELDAEQRRALAEQYGQDLADRYGVAADVCVHGPDGDNDNWHAHILLTACSCSPTGELGKKVERLDPIAALMKKTDRVTAVDFERPRWAELANAALERAGRSERIDHRTLEAQGIARAPTTHDGPARTAIKRRLRAASDAVESIQAELASAAAAAAVAAVAAVAPLAAAAEPAPAPERQAAAVPAVRRVVVAPAPVRQAAPAPVRQAAPAPVRQAAVPAPAPVRQAAVPAPAPEAPTPAVPDAVARQRALRRQAAQLAELRQAAVQAAARASSAAMAEAVLGDPRGGLVELRQALRDAQREREALERKIQARGWVARAAARLGDPEAAQVGQLRSQAQEIGRQIKVVEGTVPAADRAHTATRQAQQEARQASAAVKTAEAALKAAQVEAERIARLDALRQGDADTPGLYERDT